MRAMRGLLLENRRRVSFGDDPVAEDVRRGVVSLLLSRVSINGAYSGSVCDEVLLCQLSNPIDGDVESRSIDALLRKENSLILFRLDISIEL